jgi:hypothetical protein
MPGRDSLAMSIDLVHRDDADEPRGNVEDIAGSREVTQKDVEEVLYDQERPVDPSDSSGRRIVFGWALTDMHITAVLTL